MSKAELYELAESYRSEFPIFQTTVYLNSCSLGALSSRGRAALKEFADLWSSQGAAAWYEHWLAAATDVRSAFADLIGAEPAEVALAPSVSGALSAISSAIDFGARPRVVTPELDFPTLVYQFLAKRKLGIETVVLPSPDGVSVPIEAFAEAIDERTALVATSHVYFTTGAIQDVDAVAQLAHASGALCLIDAYQSTGQLPVDASQLGVDFLISGALKWLLGGPGLAYLYVRRPLHARLEPTIASWFGVEDQFAFDTTVLRLSPDARRFELGTPAVPAIYTGRAGLEIVSEIGVDRIRRRVASLTEDLIERAGRAGLKVRVAADPEKRSGIVLIEDDDPAGAVQRLKEASVIADYRPGVVRLSPHFYNTTDDNAAAVAVLAGVSARGAVGGRDAAR